MKRYCKNCKYLRCNTVGACEHPDVVEERHAEDIISDWQQTYDMEAESIIVVYGDCKKLNKDNRCEMYESTKPGFWRTLLGYIGNADDER